jgi:hypothetical protein
MWLATQPLREFSHNSRGKIRTEFMDGGTGAAGQSSTAMMTLVSGTYILSFDLIGSQRGLTNDVDDGYAGFCSTRPSFLAVPT